MPALRSCGLRPTAAAVAMAFTPFASHAVTYTVTNTADAGVGSLRDAINQSNTNCVSDPSPVINFNIPGSGPFTISPASPYATLQCGLGAFSPTIDATTQSGWVANSSTIGFNGSFGITLSGASVSSPGCGLHYSDPGFYGGSMVVRGLELKNFTYAGGGQAMCGIVQLYGNRLTNNTTAVATQSGSVDPIIGTSNAADRNVIANNTSAGIATAYGGNVVVTNNLIGNLDGVSAPTTNQTFGITAGGANSSTLISNNVISGNVVGITLSSDNGAQIQNNFIGTNSSGTAALQNLGAGISLSSSNSTIITGNIISGNADYGITFNSSQGVGIDSNNIGANVSGTAALPNLGGIGGNCSTTPHITNNIVSGNSGNGILFTGVDGNNVANIVGNKIGVATNGTTAIPNTGPGFAVDIGSSCFVGTGTSSNNYLSSNIIANNGGNGVILKSGTGNTILGNPIYGNAVKSININNTAGPLPNDPGDVDTGVNNQQNYPVITLVTQNAGQTTINYTLDSTPSTSFTIDFYANPAGGTPAGKTPISTQGIITPAAGTFSGSLVASGLFDFIAATATKMTTGDTSEFSAIVSVTATPAVTIVPTSLAFGNVVVNTTSTSQSSTLTSSGAANYVINTFDTAATCYGAALCYGGPFICSTNCLTSPSSYAPSASCTVTASFAPIALGPQTSTIYICDNAAGSPHTITLSGTGVAAPPLAVYPASQDFGNVPTGTVSSPPIIFNFSNPGAGPAPISAPATTGPFRIAGTNCGATIPPSSSCNVNVSFAPVANGFAYGTVFLTTGTSSVSANLTGTGITAPQIVLPPPVDLGSGTLGVSSLSQTIVLTNSGNAPLNFSSITVTPPFTLDNQCPQTLGPGASCNLLIGIPSSTPGTFNGTLTIVSNGGSGTVALTANVQPVPTAVLKVGPNQVGFGDRIAGTTSATQRITVLNEGGQPAAMTGINASPDFVVVGNTCTGTLAPQATCFVDVAMRAIGFGQRLGSVVIGSNASNAPHTVTLAGTGCRPYSVLGGGRIGPRANCAP